MTAVEQETQTITISITADGVHCATELSVPDLVFWLEVVKNMVVTDTLGGQESTTG